MTFTDKLHKIGWCEETIEEPYTNRSLFRTSAMHDYLERNKLKSLIPAAYKK